MREIFKLNKKPLISVILPVFNGDKFLSESIKSILNQTISDLELIIINDGSVDNSYKIIKKYAIEDSRIKLINRKNKGLIYSLNEGISISNGVYLARMDADDISHHKRFEEQVKFFNTHSDVDILGTWMEAFGNGKNKIYKYYCSDKLIKESLSRGIGSGFGHPTVMMKRSSLLKYLPELYDKKYIYAEDFALWSKLSKELCFANLPMVLLKYRLHDNNISSVYNKQQLESKSQAISDYCLTKKMKWVNFYLNRRILKIKKIKEFT